jgi:hypothetical protein
MVISRRNGLVQRLSRRTSWKEEDNGDPVRGAYTHMYLTYLIVYCTHYAMDA